MHSNVFEFEFNVLCLNMYSILIGEMASHVNFELYVREKVYPEEMAGDKEEKLIFEEPV